MEIPEFNRHRIRAQIIKIIAHVHEARKQLTLCDEHEKIIRNASNLEGIATLQLDFKILCDNIDFLRDTATLRIMQLSEAALILYNAMDNPNNTMPPMHGRFLALVDRTPLQRTLIREGLMPYSDLPTHYHQIPKDQNLKPGKPRKLPPKPTPKKRKPKRKDMPL